MNSRKPIRRDPVDLVIASTLKEWIQRSPQPPQGKVSLLQAAGAEHEQVSLGSLLRTGLHSLILGLSKIPDALVGDPVFETYQRDSRGFSREAASTNLNLMNISFFYSHTPRLGLFSILL